jgi:hypothetical protein
MKQEKEFLVIRAHRTAFKEGMFNVKKRNPQAAKGAPQSASADIKPLISQIEDLIKAKTGGKTFALAGLQIFNKNEM